MFISPTLLCIPTRLSEDKRSFLYHFPYNIVIVRLAKYQGKKAFFTFAYEPDPKTLKVWQLNYYNAQSRDYYLKYSYNPETDIYYVSKYYKRRFIAEARGKESWDIFFQHVSLINPVKGEPCIIDKMGL